MFHVLSVQEANITLIFSLQKAPFIHLQFRDPLLSIPVTDSLDLPCHQVAPIMLRQWWNASAWSTMLPCKPVVNTVPVLGTICLDADMVLHTVHNDKGRMYNAMQCHYNAVKFRQNPHDRHPTAGPFGQDQDCLLWVQTLISRVSCQKGPICHA